MLTMAVLASLTAQAPAPQAAGNEKVNLVILKYQAVAAGKLRSDWVEAKQLFGPDDNKKVEPVGPARLIHFAPDTKFVDTKDRVEVTTATNTPANTEFDWNKLRSGDMPRGTVIEATIRRDKYPDGKWNDVATRVVLNLHPDWKVELPPIIRPVRNRKSS